jgi:hypothetical protein
MVILDLISLSQSQMRRQAMTRCNKRTGHEKRGIYDLLFDIFVTEGNHS